MDHGFMYVWGFQDPDGQRGVRSSCRRTNVGRGKFRNTEYFRIEGGKVKEIDVYFGRDLPAASKAASGA